MQYRTINKKNALKNWGAHITESTSIDNAEKLQWMSEMLTINENTLQVTNENLINESYGSQGPEAVPGMGAVDYGTVSNNASGVLNNANNGSGDFAQRALAMSLNVAAYTIGLELLPVLPMEFPSIMFGYLDHVYAGRLDASKDAQGTTEIFIQLAGASAGFAEGTYAGLNFGDKVFVGEVPVDATAALAAHDLTDVVYGTFLGTHRVNGEAIVRFEGTVDLTGVGATGASRTYTLSAAKPSVAPSAGLQRNAAAGFRWALLAGVAGGASAEIIDAGDALASTTNNISTVANAVTGDLVSAVDMHVPEFSKPGAEYNGTEDLKATREVGERGTQNIISLRLFSTSVEAGTIEVLAEITKTQLKDLLAYGQDGMGQLYKAAQNELSQTLNSDILGTMFKLGVTSHVKLSGKGLNLNLLLSDPATTANKPLTAFGTAKFLDIDGVDRTGDFGNINSSEANTSAENYGSRARRIATRILYAANVINTVGRHGGANFIVTNTTVATALQEAKGYRELALESDLFVNNVNLYQVGTLHGGIRVYVDPNMAFTDNRILVGRKGEETDPGLKLFVYALAESIETISESSMSPKICITSRYALVPMGHHPETNYITFAVNNEFGLA